MKDDRLWFWLVLLVLLMAASLAFGSVWLDWKEVFVAGSTSSLILRHVRLARTAGAMLAGSALAVSGYVIQTVLNNSLASPSILGIQSGAALFTAAVAVLIPYGLHISGIASFAGAILASLLILGLCWKFRVSRLTLVLAGLAVSQVFSAGTDLLITLFPDALAGYAGVKVGSLAGVSFSSLSLPAVLIFLCLGLLVLFADRLEVLSLGMEAARSLGLSSHVWMFVLLALAAGLAGSVISFAGMLGFAGLVVPHMVRRLFCGSCRKMLGANMLLGAILLLACDLLSRVLAAPYELPVSILLSLLGGPYFLWLLFHARGKRL